MVLIKNLLKFYSHKIQNAKYFITFLFLNYFLVKKHIPIFIWLLLLAELGQNSHFLERGARDSGRGSVGKPR